MKAIPSDNYLVRPFLTHKAQSYNYTFASGSNPTQITIDVANIPLLGTSYTSSAVVFVPGTAIINSSSGIYNVPLYASIKNLFYKESPYTLPYVYNPVENQFYVVSIAQKAFGETIQPGSIVITSLSSSASLVDDGHGNIVSKSPVPIWVDNFNKSNTPIGTIGSASVGLAQTGQAYTFAQSGYTLTGSISGGQLVFPSGSANIGVGGDIGLTDFTMIFTLASSSISASQAFNVTFRAAAGGTGFFFRRLIPKEMRLDFADLGAINPTGIVFSNVNDGDEYRIVASGPIITAYRNGVSGGSYGVQPTLNQSILLTGTKFTFQKNTADQAVVFDNLTIFANSSSITPLLISTPVSVSMFDNFNRATNTASLGIATSGQTWGATAGSTYGISSSIAQLTINNGTYNAAYLDAGIADATAQVTLTTQGNGSGLAFRVIDNNNLYCFESDGAGHYNIRKRVNGTESVLGTVTTATTNGDRLKVITSGSSISCYLNDTFITGTLDNFNQGATKFGLGQRDPLSTGRWDNFSITGSMASYSIQYTGTAVGAVNYSLGLIALKQFTGSFSSSTVTDAGCFFNTGSQVTVGFNASQTIYEHQAMCIMDPGDFNYSTNPSVTSGSSIVSGTTKIIDQFASQSLTPYMTTVGCYTNRGELVAVGKFPRPIKRAPDTQQTVIIRFDI